MNHDFEKRKYVRRNVAAEANQAPEAANDEGLTGTKRAEIMAAVLNFCHRLHIPNGHITAITNELKKIMQ